LVTKNRCVLAGQQQIGRAVVTVGNSSLDRSVED